MSRFPDQRNADMYEWDVIKHSERKKQPTSYRMPFTHTHQTWEIMLLTKYWLLDFTLSFCATFFLFFSVSHSHPQHALYLFLPQFIPITKYWQGHAAAKEECVVGVDNVFAPPSTHTHKHTFLEHISNVFMLLCLRNWQLWPNLHLVVRVNGEPECFTL